MTNETNTPSAGAMRAAEAVVLMEDGGALADPHARTYAELVRIFGKSITAKRDRIAAVIDRETAVPELLAALEEIVGAVDAGRSDKSIGMIANVALRKARRE